MTIAKLWLNHLGLHGQHPRFTEVFTIGDGHIARARTSERALPEGAAPDEIRLIALDLSAEGT